MHRSSPVYKVVVTSDRLTCRLRLVYKCDNRSLIEGIERPQVVVIVEERRGWRLYTNILHLSKRLRMP